jgi:hypothetical protein
VARDDGEDEGGMSDSTDRVDYPEATIFLRDSSTPKVKIRYSRYYHKGGCLCVEFADVKDDAGRPLILEVPHEQYTYALRPHMPHAGMGERD